MLHATFESELRNPLKENRPHGAVRPKVSSRSAGFLPAVEVMSMAPALSVTPNWSCVRIRSRRCVDRIFFNHHWRSRYNDWPFDDNWRSRFLDNDGGRRPIFVRLIAWSLAVRSRYRHVGRRCWRGKS